MKGFSTTIGLCLWHKMKLIVLVPLDRDKQFIGMIRDQQQEQPTTLEG